MGFKVRKCRDVGFKVGKLCIRVHDEKTHNFFVILLVAFIEALDGTTMIAKEQV